MDEMTTADVIALLRELGLGQYADKAEQNGVDGDTLKDVIDHGNLAAVLGMSDVLHQTRLRVAAGKLQKAKHALDTGSDDSTNKRPRPADVPKDLKVVAAASENRGAELLSEATKRLQQYEVTGYGTGEVSAAVEEVRRVQRLAAEEVLRREGQDEHFVPQTGAYKSIPDDEEDGSFATASLCFGFPFTFENLTEQLLLGRRWYKAELKHASQSLDQIPHCQDYTEFHTKQDIADFWSSPTGSGRRPAGSKSWNGPWLKYYTEFALNDMLNRAGIAPGSIKLISTGFEDEAGQVALLGCSISGNMPQYLMDASLVGLSGKGKGAVAEAASAAALHSLMPTFDSNPFGMPAGFGIPFAQNPMVLGFKAAAIGGLRAFTDDPYFGIEAVSTPFVTDLLQWPASNTVALTEHLMTSSKAIREKLPFLAKPSGRMHPNAGEMIYNGSSKTRPWITLPLFADSHADAGFYIVFSGGC